jgi:hypothetical protein
MGAHAAGVGAHLGRDLPERLVLAGMGRTIGVMLADGTLDAMRANRYFATGSPTSVPPRRAISSGEASCSNSRR